MGTSGWFLFINTSLQLLWLPSVPPGDRTSSGHPRCRGDQATAPRRKRFLRSIAAHPRAREEPQNEATEQGGGRPRGPAFAVFPVIRTLDSRPVGRWPT